VIVAEGQRSRGRDHSTVIDFKRSRPLMRSHRIRTRRAASTSTIMGSSIVLRTKQMKVKAVGNGRYLAPVRINRARNEKGPR
jgi:hypothetical protein